MIDDNLRNIIILVVIAAVVLLWRWWRRDNSTITDPRTIPSGRKKRYGPDRPLNRFRVLVNLVLGLAALAGAGVVFTLDRWVWGFGNDKLVFAGVALDFLAIGLLFIAAFAITVAVAWSSSNIFMPAADDPVPHPAYRIRLLMRYWYWSLPAAIAFAAAFWLAA